MTREEFIRRYAERSGLDPKWARLGFIDDGGIVVALPCACEQEDCEGWAMLGASNIPAHLSMYAPEPMRQCFNDAVDVQSQPMTARDDLLERLVATRQTNPQNLPGGFPNVEQPINPDGPEAVREIERQEARIEQLVGQVHSAVDGAQPVWSGEFADWKERAERAEARVAELEVGLRLLADENSPHDKTGQPLQVRIAKDLTRRIELAAALLKSQEQNDD